MRKLTTGDTEAHRGIPLWHRVSSGLSFLIGRGYGYFARFGSARRTKNFHLSISAAIATSKNPTIISSEV